MNDIAESCVTLFTEKYKCEELNNGMFKILRGLLSAHKRYGICLINMILLNSCKNFFREVDKLHDD